MFPAPDLEFKMGKLSRWTSLPIEDGYNRYRQGKIPMLYEHGPFSKQSLPDLVCYTPTIWSDLPVKNCASVSVMKLKTFAMLLHALPGNSRMHSASSLRLGRAADRC